MTRNSVLGENEGLHSDFCGPLLPTVTLKKSVCTGHFRYPAIMSAKTP